MRTYKQWTRQEECKAVVLTKSGLKTDAIGRRLGRTGGGVRMKLLSFGLRRQRGKGELVKEVRRLIRRGWYDWEIALELNVVRSVVTITRNRSGIPANDKLQSARARGRHESRAHVDGSGKVSGK
jgi:hypothetical protein